MNIIKPDFCPIKFLDRTIGHYFLEGTELYVSYINHDDMGCVGVVKKSNNKYTSHIELHLPEEEGGIRYVNPEYSQRMNGHYSAFYPLSMFDDEYVFHRKLADDWLERFDEIHMALEEWWLEASEVEYDSEAPKNRTYSEDFLLII